MFFSKAGVYEAAGLYSIGHFVLFIITIIGVIIALNLTKTKKHEEIRKIIQIIAIFLWVLEIIKILFNIAIGNERNPNTFIPLYYCSIILYATMFSGFSEGWLKHTGDVFIATGGIVGGIAFICCPTTSLPMYPAFHYISIQSFVFHGIMIYLGILLNVTEYIKLEKNDIKYYFSLVGIICVISLLYNNVADSNLMFVSKNYPGTPIEIIYNITGKTFTAWMIAIQCTIPFYIIMGIKELSNKYRK